ncbi:acyltransferase family protein [Dyella sp. 2RAB6]|uniref:acyltransferase family protein n=1 Tax=Dyella sp. 2RAB6 TaxID=3232992 RepID=UPI003F90FF3D
MDGLARTDAHKLAWIQALRGLAALMVVMVHSRSMLLGTAAGKAIADQVLLPMAMGVDLFFIISGFLMVWTTRDFDGSKAYVGQFLARRFARIWPLLAVITPIALVVEHGFGGWLDRALVLSYAEGLAFIPHDPGASGIYFQMAVGVAWTLCFEWYFYLVFALAMFFGRWRYVVMAAWFALTLLAIPLWRGGYTLQVAAQPLVAWSRYANLAINPIVWDFVAGMAAGWLYGSRVRIGSAAMVYAVAMLWLTLLWMVWQPLGMVNFFGPLGWGAPLAIVFVGIVLLAKIDALKLPRWSVWMGGISYSLYLVHVYVFELMQRVATALSLSHPAFEIVLLLTRPVMAVICAWALFRYVERPLSAWTRARLSKLSVPWRLRGKHANSASTA